MLSLSARIRRIPVVACLALFLSQTASLAAIVAIPASRDNTLYEDSAGALSNGSGAYVFTGRAGNGLLRRGVLAFDVRGSIPAGSVITGATLKLSMSRTSAGPDEIGLHRLLADWGEGASVAAGEGGNGTTAVPGDATWIHRVYDEVAWATPGGDFAPAASATATVDQIEVYTWGSTPEMVADVQGWLDDPATNFGWILKATEGSTSSAKRFDSRQGVVESVRPVLLVELGGTCDPSPAQASFWGRQCGGTPVADGGLAWGRILRGPSEVTEPGFVENVIPCANAMLTELGLGGLKICKAIEAQPFGDPCEQAQRQLAAEVLNVCSGRLQVECPLQATGQPCAAPTVGERLQEIVALFRAGDCDTARVCAAAVTEQVFRPGPEIEPPDSRPANVGRRSPRHPPDRGGRGR